jgi:uncharacterized protein YfaT (DUF1175 family)
LAILAHSHRPAVPVAIGIMLLIGFVWGRSALVHRHPLRLMVSVTPQQLLADGHEIATIASDQRPTRIVVVDGAHRAHVEEDARIRAGVLPGVLKLRVEATGFLPATIELRTTLQTSDRHSDGTPDFLRLDDDHDQQAFRRWFTFLAEAQYFQAPEARPSEINDCAALIRYAYREALRNHDGAWAADVSLPLIPALDSIGKYEYPYTPLGPALFRVRSGPFRVSDLSDGTFTQFADAQTLQRLNTHYVTRDVARAAPGDLLFFRQLSEHMPFHSMIYLGNSQIGRGGARYVLYHTGPTGSEPGEIRRLPVEELLHYPEPQWRPLSTNPSFLGVYRWNILEREL